MACGPIVAPRKNRVSKIERVYEGNMQCEKEAKLAAGSGAYIKLGMTAMATRQPDELEILWCRKESLAHAKSWHSEPFSRTFSLMLPQSGMFQR